MHSRCPSPADVAVCAHNADESDSKIPGFRNGDRRQTAEAHHLLTIARNYPTGRLG
jgi:hypothetical protein